MSDKNKPEDILRDGSLKASIWRNESDKGVYFSTTLAKTYKDQDGNLRDTHSFSGTELLRVSELSRHAYTRSNELYREHMQSHDQGREQFKKSRSQENRQDQSKHIDRDNRR